MSTNPYSKLLNAYPRLCCTLYTISSADLNYANLSFWVSKRNPAPLPQLEFAHSCCLEHSSTPASE